MAVLTEAGYRVELASRLRSRDGAGDPAIQARLAAAGTRLSAHLIRRYRMHPGTAPDVWFTYHLYYKAPDWIGPDVAAALGIPYVVVEASVANKRASGPWAASHAAVLRALRRADLVVGLTAVERQGVVPCLEAGDRWMLLKPFIDTAPF
ncbi:MAG: glycosyltransferase family 1 protein, partial [Alphaproteobacteria bacterium]|nr:glycosyltransferase family 1 protein [Alphaproteobacteria bacterium]